MDECYILLSLLQDWATELQKTLAKRPRVLNLVITRLDQYSILEFSCSQGSPGADEPREDPLHCCLLMGRECCGDSLQYPVVAITLY